MKMNWRDERISLIKSSPFRQDSNAGNERVILFRINEKK